MFAAMADWMSVPLLQYEGGKPPKQLGLAHPSIAPYGVFQTRDGLAILISIQNDREWSVLAEKVLDDPELARDPDFATNVDRVARRDETDARVTAVFSTRSSAELAESLAVSEIAFAPVTDMKGLSSHPHLQRVEIATRLGPCRIRRRPRSGPIRRVATDPFRPWVNTPEPCVLSS